MINPIFQRYLYFGVLEIHKEANSGTGFNSWNGISLKTWADYHAGKQSWPIDPANRTPRVTTRVDAHASDPPAFEQEARV